MNAEREKDIREIARTNRGFINHALVDALAALDECRRERAEERDAAMWVLDGFDAPTRSGGVTLNLIGRIRALRSKLVIEGNQTGVQADRALSTWR